MGLSKTNSSNFNLKLSQKALYVSYPLFPLSPSIGMVTDVMRQVLVCVCVCVCVLLMLSFYGGSYRGSCGIDVSY